MPLGIGIGLKRRDDNGGGTVEPIPPYFINLLMPKDRSLYFGAYAISGEVGVPTGTGTELDPYLISNLEELIWVSENSEKWNNKWYKQTADINAYQTMFMNAGAGFFPIGNPSRPFNSNYNGQQYKIENLYINSTYSQYAGMFGFAYGWDAGEYSSTNIHDINLVNVTVISNGVNVGGLIGKIENGDYVVGTAVVSNCKVTGRVTGYDTVGGFVGSLYYGNMISNCTANVIVSGSYLVGGFAGNCIGGKFLNCYSRSNVSRTETHSSYVGGFVSSVLSGNIQKCYSTGRCLVNGVLATNVGFIGKSSGTNTYADNYWDVELSGSTTTAGIADGLTTAEAKTRTEYTNYDFKFGTDTGHVWNIGNERNDLYPYLDWQYPDDMGYVIQGEITTQACSSVELETATANGNITVLSSPNPTQHGHCWALTENPTVNNYKTELGEAIATGAFTSNMTGLTENTTYYVRAYMVCGTNYCYGEQVTLLTGKIPVPVEPEGSGTYADPYLIANSDNLMWISATDEEVPSPIYETRVQRLKWYKQTADIDAYYTKYVDSGAGYRPIGKDNTVSAFQGFYYGQGYTISNLFINRPTLDYVGMFGKSARVVDQVTYGVINNVHLIDADITGKDYVGGISGFVGEFKVTNCTITGTVTGNNNVGGIVGKTDGLSARFDACFSYADIIGGQEYVGGLMGNMSGNPGYLTCCLATGDVSGESSVGGLIGFANSMYDPFRACYARGKVTRTGAGSSTRIGGLVGYNLNKLDYCYSTGQVYFGETLQTNRGLIGEGAGNTALCVWDMDSSGASSSGGNGEVGLTSAQMKSETYMRDTVFFDFNWEWLMNALINDGYPYLRIEMQAKENPMIPVAGGVMTLGITPTTLSDYKISKYEIQQGEWDLYMTENASSVKNNNQLPVDKMNWYSALVYCNLRSISESKTPCYTISGTTNPLSWGAIPTTNNTTWNAVTCDWDADGYRLPTEAEFEYAARGGQDSEGYTYSGSNTANDVSWNSSNAASPNNKIHVVGLLLPSELTPYGTYDMSGNCHEWCWDWYKDNPFPSSATNPRGATTGSQRVRRGGNYTKAVSYHETTYRSSQALEPYSIANGIGFRVATKGDVS